ncbi:MAG: hypothetical protein ACRC37_04910 [Lentisphaeria bacterium]
MAVKLQRKNDLEQKNIERQNDSDRKVREQVCQNRKEELSRLLRDLQRMHSDFTIENSNNIESLEKKQKKLDKEKLQLQKILELINKASVTDPIDCPNDQMATVANNLENIRRSILAINSNSAIHGNTNSYDKSIISGLDNKKVLLLGVLFCAPLIITMFTCFMLFSIIFVIVF